MASYLVVGSEDSCNRFTEDLVAKEDVKDIFINVINDTLKIDEARQIRKNLSSKHSEKRLYIIKNGMTIEAQNSLLKTIEELDSFSIFVLFAPNPEDYLPTVRSRCYVKHLGLEENPGGYEILLKSVDPISYSDIDRLAKVCSRQTVLLLPTLRKLLLSEALPIDVRRKYYGYCKKLLNTHRLSEVNNVSEKIVLEHVFLS